MNVRPGDLATSVNAELVSTAGLIVQVLEGPVPGGWLRAIRPGNTPSDFLMRWDTGLPTHCRELVDETGADGAALGCGNADHVV